MNPNATPEQETGSWGELFGRHYVGAITVLAGGITLYAINVYLTASLLPAAVADIGGADFYAWTTTVFLLASVVSSVMVSRLLGFAGPRGAYWTALAAFGLGTVVCAAAPSMLVLIVGRTIQGAGGGLLSGLGYALIRSTLPSRLWARGSALVSAMWGVGTFIGPAVGGLFAEVGLWRGAFVTLGAVTLLIAAIVPRALAADRPDTAREPLPLAALVLLSAAALVVSLASIVATPVIAAAAVALGLVLIVAFILHERRSSTRVLPSETFRRHARLPWIYLTIAILAMGSNIELFVPLFGQRLAALTPLLAGFLGAAIAAGWTLGELPSANAFRAASVRHIVIAGPAVLATGLLLTAVTQAQGAGAWLVLCWAGGLILAGSGIGMAWPHLATRAMHSASDPAEGNKASAAINIVQLVANAMGTALAGLLVNLAGDDLLRSAQFLFFGFAILTACGIVTATLGTRTEKSVGHKARAQAIAAPSGPT